MEFEKCYIKVKHIEKTEEKQIMQQCLIRLPKVTICVLSMNGHLPTEGLWESAFQANQIVRAKASR